MARNRIALLAAAVAVLVVLGAALAPRLEVRTDLSFFLPETPTPAARLVAEGLREGPATRLVLMAISGGTPEKRHRASDALAQGLIQSGRFAFVANGRPRLPEPELQQILRYRYLLNPTIEPSDFSTETLRQDFERALAVLGTTIGTVAKRLIPADPTFRVREIAASWSPPEGPRRRDGVWVSKIGDSALLIARSSAQAFDLEQQNDSIALVKRVFSEIPGAAALRLTMSGPSVFSVRTRDAIRTEIRWLTLASAVLVAGLLLAAFRSPFVLAVVLLPIASGALGGAAAVQAIFGHVHGVTLAFGGTLIGIAIDYPLHLAAHSTHETPALVAVRRIWPTMRLGALTTAVAFLPLSLSSFPGLSQLGVFTIAGLVIAALVTRWLLPSLLPATGARDPRETRLGTGLSAGLERATPIAAVAAVAIGAAYFASRDEPPWENDLSRLSPVPQASLRFDQALRAELGAPDVRRLIAVRGDTSEQVLRRSEDLLPQLRAFVRERKLTGFDMAARYVPSGRTQKTRQEILPDPQLLKSRINAAAGGLPFRSDLFAPFMSDVERARTGPTLSFDELSETPLGSRLTSLLFRRGGQWIGLIQLAGVRNPEEILAFVAAANDPKITYIDLKQEADDLMAGYRGEALNWLAIGAVAALIMLFGGLRRTDAVVRVMVPICVSVFLTAAILLVTGHDLSMLHLLALLLVAGLGLDYSLFLNRAFGSTEDARRTMKAVVLCNLTTIVVFTILAFSQLVVLNSIGKTVAIGAALSLLTSYGFRRKPSRGLE